MGSEMSEVLPNLYVGSLSNSQDTNQLKKFKITHIISILENPYRFETYKDKKYFHIKASESPKQNLEKIFPSAIDFIHKARLENGRVLIHCVSGISRSVTIACAYIMSYSKLSFQDSLNVIKSVRPRANPSWYFKKQLLNFERTNVANVQSFMLSNLRQSNDDCEKIQIDNLVIEDKCDSKLKDDILDDHVKVRQCDSADNVDLVNEIYQVATNVLENGIVFKD